MATSDSQPTRLVVGCGYLGGRVAAAFRDRGDRVLVTTRGRSDELRGQGFEPLPLDVTDRAALADGLPRVDTVVYAVGFDRTAGREMRDVYVTGLTNVLIALPRPGRFVYVSSTGVYGQHDGEQVDESAPTEPAEESGRVVLAAERVLRELCPQAVTLRFAGIYGPGRLMRQDDLRAGRPLKGNPEKWLNLIHVDDGTSAVLAAAGERGEPGTATIVSDDRPVRRREFYAALAEALSAPPPRFEPPAPGEPPPPHERADRRLVNRRLRERLGVDLQYPDCFAGLRAVAGA